MTKTIRLFVVALLAGAGVLAFSTDASAGLRDRRCNTCGTSACSPCGTYGTPGGYPVATTAPAPARFAGVTRGSTCCPTPCAQECCPTTRRHVFFQRRRHDASVCADPCATPGGMYAYGAPAMMSSSPPIAPAATRMPTGLDTGVKPATAQGPTHQGHGAPIPPPAVAVGTAGGCGGCGPVAAPCCGEQHQRRFALRGRRGGACCN